MDGKRLTEQQVNELCNKWAGAPGIVRGIMEAWKADGGKPSLSINDIFDGMFGRDRK